MSDTLPSVEQLNEDIARGLKQDGHSSTEVLQKMVDVHQVSPGQALALTSKVFGKRADQVGSDTSSQVMTGLTLIAVGAAGGAIVYFFIGFTPIRLAVPLYALAFGCFSSGLIAAVRALVK